MTFTKIFRGVFYGEIIINLVTAVISIFAPIQYAAMFVSHPAGPITELLRWYGILLVVFAYLELRALLSKRDEILTVILEGFLVGDIIQLVALIPFVNATGGWSVSLIATLVITIVLALSRIGWLRTYYGQKARKGEVIA
jgi:hypothetical protein